jgi:hypothetical protein
MFAISFGFNLSIYHSDFMAMPKQPRKCRFFPEDQARLLSYVPSQVILEVVCSGEGFVAPLISLKYSRNFNIEIGRKCGDVGDVLVVRK